MGICLNFKEHQITWEHHSIPMSQPHDIISTNHIQEIETFYAKEVQEDLELFSTEILDRNYEHITAKQVSDQQSHLTKSHQKLLLNSLSKYQDVFNGKLGRHPTAKISIQLKPNAQPVLSLIHISEPTRPY